MKEKLIIFPTDTVYGIGCGIFDKKSIEKIYEIKHRPKSKPLACLCANLSQVKKIAFIDKNAEVLIRKFMPGALTLILPAKDNVKKITGFETIGVRIPNSKLAIYILENYGPMLTTSVNESEKTPLNNYDEIVSVYGNLVDRVYKSDGVSSNVASTVVKLSNNHIEILREGEIKESEIYETLNK